MEDGKLIGCALTTRTLAQRIHSYAGDDNNEGGPENEDHPSIG